MAIVHPSVGGRRLVGRANAACETEERGEVGCTGSPLAVGGIGEHVEQGLESIGGGGKGLR